MDFHSLTRRELQSLCKLNKISANITNVAMAEKLQSLEIVEGVDQFFKVSQSEKAELVESTEKLEVSSTKVTNTRRRATTRQKVKNTEAENLPPTSTRTIRRGRKQVTGGLEESNNDKVQTPALSSSKGKALEASTCQNVKSQPNDYDEEGFVDPQSECKPGSPEKVVKINRRKGAATSTTMKKESDVQKTYNCRRSTRLTEKKSEKAVDVEKGDYGEVENLKPESDEIGNPHEDGDLEEKLKTKDKFDLGEEDTSEVTDKQESDGISNSLCENVDLEDDKVDLGKKFDDVSEVMVPEEHSDSVLDENADIESGTDMILEKTENPSESMDLDDENTKDIKEMSENTILVNNEKPSESLNSDYEKNISPLEENTNDINQGSENMVDEPLDVIPTIDVFSTITEEVEDLNSEVFFENNDANSGELTEGCSSIEEKNQNSSTLVDVIDHSTDVTPIKKSASKKDMQKTPAFSTSTTTMKKENTSEINWLSNEVMVTSDEIPKNSIEKGNPDAKVEAICDIFEKLDVLVEEKEDSGEVENLKPESDEITNPYVNGDLEDKTNEVILKPESDDISNPCENVDLKEEEEKLDASEVMVPEEHSDGFLDENGSSSTDMIHDNNFNPADENTRDIKERSENTVADNENPSESMNLDYENNNQGSRNMVDDMIDVITEEVEDLKPEFLSEKSDADSSYEENNQNFLNSSTLVDVIDHLTDVTPIKKTPALFCTRRKSPATWFCVNVNSGLNVYEEEYLVKSESAGKRSTTTTKKESGVCDEILEKSTGAGDPDAKLDKDISISFEKESSGEFENLKPESDDTSNPCENADLEEELGDKLNSSIFVAALENLDIKDDIIRKTVNEEGEKLKKKMSCIIVSDDKENIEMMMGKKKKEEMVSLKEISIRQLRKQIKALTLKTINNTNKFKQQEGRATLQPVCENQTKK